MAILIYQHSFSNAPFQNKVANQLSPSATVNLLGGFLSPLVALDITSVNSDDTDGTNLDDFMAELGFTRVTSSGIKILDQTTHWGSFEVADAPTLASNGDDGFCTNGDAGIGRPVYYDGANWRVVHNNNIISAV